MEVKPLYKHDCDRCHYLGVFECKNKYFNNIEQKFDLYYCDSDIFGTVIARYSDEPHEYISGIEIAYSRSNPMLIEAYNRAFYEGCLKNQIVTFTKNEFCLMYFNFDMLSLYVNKYGFDDNNWIIYCLYEIVFNRLHHNLFENIDSIYGNVEANSKTIEYIVAEINKIVNDKNLVENIIQIDKNENLNDFSFSIPLFTIKNYGSFDEIID